MRKKTIISIMPHLKGGGVEKVVCQLSDGLSQYDDCDVHIITIKPYESLIPISNSVKIHHVDTTIRNSLNLRISEKSKSKLIVDYIKNNITTSEPELILCHQDTVSKIMRHSEFNNTFHVIHSTLSHDKLSHSTGLKRLLRRNKLRSLYKGLNIICVSKGVEEDLKTNFKLTNTSVIYNAVCQQALERYVQEPTQLPSKKYFINVGNFSRAKRQDRLVRAYLEANIKDVDLVLLGEYSHRTNEIHDLMAQMEGADKRIHMPGFVSNPYPWIANSSGFILSSDYEGLPTVLLESIALGTPVISTDCNSGPREIFGENFKHCLSEVSTSSLRDKIIELYNSPKDFTIPLREEFSLNFMSRQYYKLIKQHR
ncbi:glycosyltransferase [Vibrio parahaemolyticus]|uniref:glycosyltransferase n=1 Tax=Vibrio parahaemolyticus TaxID=670 RepID=UPI00112102E8|nr:glycosyltransferase [Vibrio parahaemolyticus]EJG1669413.1 glycosyltransferase [Vibrio parahaemolyticus]EJG1777506.1 glycosyltransferase [Vibrio parahaemolyticus]TOJ16606.1 hypothetical protein CGI44_23150 [Vibrio parahaemolyticus]TOJ52294.1 hypothetical protein CGI37_22080 [Vibrio parahaemolyticus]